MSATEWILVAATMRETARMMAEEGLPKGQVGLAIQGAVLAEARATRIMDSRERGSA